jgi:hypothetical protein
MSTEMVSHKIKKTCEGCGVERVYEMVNATAETITEMENWYTIVREMLVPGPQGPQYEKFMVQAHEPACVPVAILKLMKLGTMEMQEQQDEINLKDLQQQKDTTVN